METSAAFADHDAGPAHPERPARLDAVLAGIEGLALGSDVVPAEPRRATIAELSGAHEPAFIEALARFCARGGGQIDADTSVGAGSWEAALLATGAGLDAVERLRLGQAEAAFCVARPPGHHATANRAMGFCLINSIAVCAAALASDGERVVIVDWDAHHGNGTSQIFWADPRVLYVSMHQWPLYPGTGRLEEIGAGPGEGLTVNLPFPPGTTGNVYMAAFERVVAPAAAAFGATWVLVSAGFDAHRACPLTSLGLAAGDYSGLGRCSAALAAPGRCVAFLEGGYDLDAIEVSAAAFVAALAGEQHRPAEPPTAGGPGMTVVEAAARLHAR